MTWTEAIIGAFMVDEPHPTVGLTAEVALPPPNLERNATPPAARPAGGEGEGGWVGGEG